MNLIDLTMPVETGHFRWPVEQTVAAASGGQFHVTTVRLSCHAFTHMDARRHMDPVGPTLDQTPLEDIVGEAAVIDLSDAAPNAPIDAEALDRRGAHLRQGDIVLMRSCWDEQRSWREKSYWTEAPWLTRGAAEWLWARRPRAVAFDFPQDFTIRLSFDGVVPPFEDHVTHDVLLRAGVTLVEYLVNTRHVTTERTGFAALPLKLVGSDGAPCRVITHR